MIRIGYNEHALWRLVERHVPGFAWKFGVSIRRLLQEVMDHLYPRALPPGSALADARGYRSSRDIYELPHR